MKRFKARSKDSPCRITIRDTCFPPLLVINFEITTNIIALAGSNVKFGSVALDLPLQFSVMVAHVRLDLWDECCQRARFALFPDLQLPAALAHYGKRGYL